MGDVLGNRGLADAICPDDDGVGRVIEEAEGHQGLDGGAVTFGPGPVEVA